MSLPTSDLSSPSPDRPLPLFWRLLETYFHRAYRMETLEDDPEALLAYNFYTYRGPDVPLRCGTVIHGGDRLLELHFRREALLPLIQDGDSAHMGLGLVRLAERDVPRLALVLERDPRFQEVKALHALTLFYRGTARYGFEVMPVRQWWAERWFTWWHRRLMARDHAQGDAHVEDYQERLVSRHIWVSRLELIHRYGTHGRKRRAPAANASAPR